MCRMTKLDTGTGEIQDEQTEKVANTVVYGEIRLATGSVLPAWVMHTIGNAIGNTLLPSSFVQLSPGRELWFSPGAESVISIMLMFSAGYWLHQRRKNAARLSRSKEEMLWTSQ
jgi:hypothetical protein